jgi:nucleoside-diphosphate-sugar epimerase
MIRSGSDAGADAAGRSGAGIKEDGRVFSKSGAGPDLDLQSSIIGLEDRILVTGGNGYVGSRVVRFLLAAGFRNVRVLARPMSRTNKLDDAVREFGGAGLDVVKGNLLSPEACRAAAAGVSVILHLAAGVEKSFPGCFLNSVVTTRNLLEAALAEPSFKRIVNISSLAVYTNERIPRRGVLDESCAVETHLVERSEAYTFGKVKQDEIVEEYGRTRGLPYVILRPGVIFGPGKAKITDRVGSATFGVFLHLGLGNRIPLTYVDNCAEAVVLAGLKKGIEGQVFNILDDDLPTSRQFLRLYKRHVRRFFSLPVPYALWRMFCSLWESYCRWSKGQLPPVFNPRTCAVSWKGNVYPNRKAKEGLGWRPRVPMREALLTFFEYMRDAEGQKK